MKKRQSKEAYIAIDNYIKQQSYIDSSKLTKLVSDVVEIPEYEELTTDYCRKIANNRIRQMRDSNGVQIFFSNGDKVSPKYINVDTATTADIYDIHKALKKQENHQTRAETNMKKLRARMTILEGQISLGEYNKTKEQNESESPEALQDLINT